MYEDKTLVCKDCGAEFVFTAGEQEFYAEKGFVNDHRYLCSLRQGSKSTVSAERRPCGILQRMLCKDEGS